MDFKIEKSTVIDYQNKETITIWNVIFKTGADIEYVKAFYDETEANKCLNNLKEALKGFIILTTLKLDDSEIDDIWF